MVALNAGCDIVLLCNQSVKSESGEAIDEFLDGMQAASERGDWTPREASEIRRLALLPATPTPSWDALMADPRYMHALDLLP